MSYRNLYKGRVIQLALPLLFSLKTWLKCILAAFTVEGG